MAGNPHPPSAPSVATMVALPPVAAELAPRMTSNKISNITGGGGDSSLGAVPTSSLAATDPESLLDALDSSYSTTTRTDNRNHHHNLADGGYDYKISEGGAEQDDGDPSARNSNNFDPIEFLNQHYHTEQQLTAALPALRSAISSRLTRLDETLSTTLRHQAALAPTLAKDVVHARSAVLKLVQRIQQVQAQAQKSELAVLEITKDMKRLDHAKKHLQRTITALKRLHMLLHAAEQLRMAAMVSPAQPIPQYRAAAHLVDATRLLLGHFEGYMDSVPKMRQVRDAVGVIKGQLWEGIVKLFREVGQRDDEPLKGAFNDIHEDADRIKETDQKIVSVNNKNHNNYPPSTMVQSTLADACLVIEALGPKSKDQFVSDFISAHLLEYDQLYNPSPDVESTPSSEGTKSGSESIGKTFKKNSFDVHTSVSVGRQSTSSSLETVENRFMWYRSKLRFLQQQFTHVFPSHWNVHYCLTVKFLEMTARHLKFILKRHYSASKTIRSISSDGGIPAGSGTSALSASSIITPGGAKDNVSENEKAVTLLLKTLQKTILFEKEMTAWLTRDFGANFIDPSKGKVATTKSDGIGAVKKESEGIEEDDDLEFDEHGRAVPAKSAEGIKIKYERRKNGATAGVQNNLENSEAPVPPVIGIASTIFDDHMFPYVALEERSMDEQLQAAASDSTVDTRGERPVFVSSTTLFIYMKNSINRCTALTKEKTFFLLQRAFQKKLRGYAGVLEKKLPSPVSQNVVAKLALTNIPGSSNIGSHMSSTPAGSVAYRIPPGEEVTICHVIDTCEYCSDTVEALEDLIRDKIGDKFKESVDMSEEQGAFQDVTAKSIRVLVSGLEQRLDSAFKEISRTNWASFDTVGEESSYVRSIHLTVQPFVVQIRSLIPSSYFRSFCDKFALAFASSYFRSIVGLKRISETGTQQLLLDVYSVKTLMLRLPVLEAEKKPVVGSASSRNIKNSNLSGGSTIAPAMYTKMVNKEFRKLEVLLKLVGSTRDSLVEMFRAQWDCSTDTARMASDFTMITTLKGISRADNAVMLEMLGFEVGEGGIGTESSSMAVNIQTLQERGSDVAAKVNADLNQMRQRVDDFRKAFR